MRDVSPFVRLLNLFRRLIRRRAYETHTNTPGLPEKRALVAAEPDALRWEPSSPEQPAFPVSTIDGDELRSARAVDEETEIAPPPAEERHNDDESGGEIHRAIPELPIQRDDVVPERPSEPRPMQTKVDETVVTVAPTEKGWLATSNDQDASDEKSLDTKLPETEVSDKGSRLPDVTEFHPTPSSDAAAPSQISDATEMVPISSAPKAHALDIADSEHSSQTEQTDLLLQQPDSTGEGGLVAPSSSFVAEGIGAAPTESPDGRSRSDNTTSIPQRDSLDMLLSTSSDNRNSAEPASLEKASGRTQSFSGVRGPRAATRPSAANRRPPTVSIGWALPESYTRWNRVLIEHCLLNPTPESGPAYLSITPRILSAALEGQQNELLSPVDAVEDFVTAISGAYQTCILNQAEKLWVLSAFGPDGNPLSCAFLALSVLAAFYMHTDEDAGSNAYYPRLAEILRVPIAGDHPVGFDPTDFAELWERLSAWLEDQSGRPLALPGSEPGLRRYVAYPLCHVPLRQLDIEKLPDFFDWAGLEPGNKIDPISLLDAFQRWAAARGQVSQAGQRAIVDERRGAVQSQLAFELESWDGSGTDRLGSRTAAVQIHLDFPRRQPHLSFLPRRPVSFPAPFDDGVHLFDGGEQGWYEPLAITADDGPDLESGFQWACSSPTGKFTLQRQSSRVIALRPAEFVTGFLSQRGLPFGVASAVLCIDALEGEVGDFLTRVTSVRCRAMRGETVPNGWCLFSGVVPQQIEPTPPGLEPIAIDPAVTVILQGGLRIGRRAAWLAGAPPSILIGGAGDLAVAIDRKAAAVHGGIVDTSQHLGVGVHVLEVGRVRRKLEIVESPETWGDLEPLVADDGDERAVALPPGRWTVIGSRPDEVATAVPSNRGTLIAARFRPVWAVRVGIGRGADVLCLTPSPPSPETRDFARVPPPRSARPRVWVGLIYDASIRRPRLGWLGDAVADVQLRSAWRSYSAEARSLKRRWRQLR